MEADTWRTGKSTGDRGEKLLQRREVRTRSCGILQPGWLDAELRAEEGGKEVRPPTLAGPNRGGCLELFLRVRDKLVTKSVTEKF